jgi:hypothetical protein
VIGARLSTIEGFPFEVRHSEGAFVRARLVASIAADAYAYFAHLFSLEPNLALIVADESDWESRQPYGLPFFNDDEGQIRPGIVVMPAGKGDFWVAMVDDLRVTTPEGYGRLLTTYPDGEGGVDLQPFFDLITIHELGHAFEAFGELKLSTFWLGEIFANLCLHAFVTTKRPQILDTLEVLSLVGASSTGLDTRMKREGFTTLEELEVHYTGGGDPMSAENYVWYQYRWQRLAAAMFDAEGEEGLVRFWEYFRAVGQRSDDQRSATSMASVLSSQVSETLGRAVREWPSATAWSRATSTRRAVNLLGKNDAEGAE